MSMQFRPVAPPPPPQPFVPVPPQQFQPGGHSNMGMPPHPPPIQYPQAVPPPQQQPPPQRPSLPGHGLPQGPPLPPPDFQPNRPVMSAPPQPQISNNFMPSFGGPRISHVSYSLSSSSGGQQQINVVSTAQHLPMSQTEAPNFSAVGQPWYPTGNQNVQPVLPMQQPVEQSAGEQTWSSTVTQNIKPVTPLQQNGEQNAGAQQWFPSGNQNVQSNTPQQNEEQSASVVNLRADASTDWREITTPEGRRFYFNKVTKQSKWAIPDEVKGADTSAGISESGGNNASEVKKVEHGPLVYESKEFIGQKKKQEAEEKRARQKKARENFKKMLQESKDLTSSTRWSKAISMFEKDERFQAVERAKDREDLFEDHLEELKKKERAKALDEHKRHKAEYLEFLKSCDFVKASSQWRKVQNRLEADERCSRLEKVERLEIFQEYIRDLEMEEEEQRKLRMVKDAPAYLAVSSNTSGSTAKDLFEDVIDDLEKQISLSMNWTFEDFKGALPKEISPKPISDINLKEITSSSKWEDCRPLVEERFVGEESFFREIFDKVILELKEKAKGKERKRKEEKAKKEKEKERKDKEKKEKERKDKDRGESRKGKERYRIDETDSDESESYSLEEKKRSKDRNKKHHKRSMGSFDDTSLDDDEKDRSRSHRHSADSKKAKQKEKDKQTWSAEADSESQSKRHKKDHWDASDKNTDHEENKDGEFGEDGEVQ
ncbi:UNVERIFIED_CONTAM: Pre-processing protein 40A [Sesamum latifolium]|uniref:Pre-processing protein 40A n=1 Tax=Sesamum latifolium TaxID=2727402 RepID=A0AAW2XJB7_9LAMI